MRQIWISKAGAPEVLIADNAAVARSRGKTN